MLVAAESGFAERLRSLRESAGLSQYQLAKLSEVSAQAISRIEKGQREPNWLTVVKLAKALNVSVAAFEQEGEPDPPAPAKKPKKK